MAANGFAIHNQQRFSPNADDICKATLAANGVASQVVSGESLIVGAQACIPSSLMTAKEALAAQASGRAAPAPMYHLTTAHRMHLSTRKAAAADGAALSSTPLRGRRSIDADLAVETGQQSTGDDISAELGRGLADLETAQRATATAPSPGAALSNATPSESEVRNQARAAERTETVRAKLSSGVTRFRQTRTELGCTTEPALASLLGPVYEAHVLKAIRDQDYIFACTRATLRHMGALGAAWASILFNASVDEAVDNELAQALRNNVISIELSHVEDLIGFTPYGTLLYKLMGAQFHPLDEQEADQVVAELEGVALADVNGNFDLCNVAAEFNLIIGRAKGKSQHYDASAAVQVVIAKLAEADTDLGKRHDGNDCLVSWQKLYAGAIALNEAHKFGVTPFNDGDLTGLLDALAALKNKVLKHRSGAAQARSAHARRRGTVNALQGAAPHWEPAATQRGPAQAPLWQAGQGAVHALAPSWTTPETHWGPTPPGPPWQAAPPLPAESNWRADVGSWAGWTEPQGQGGGGGWSGVHALQWGGAEAQHYAAGQYWQGDESSWMSDGDAAAAYENSVFAIGMAPGQHTLCDTPGCGAYLSNSQVLCRGCARYIKGCWGCSTCGMVSPPWNDVCWYLKNGGCQGKRDAGITFDVRGQGSFQANGVRICEAAAARLRTQTTSPHGKGGAASTALVSYSQQGSTGGKGASGKGAKGGQGTKGGKSGKGGKGEESGKGGKDGKGHRGN